MAVSCWDNPHLVPPLQCPTNETVWSELIVADSTKVRASHVHELRDAINAELSRRGLDTLTWAETVTADVTEIRQGHIDELRTALGVIKTGDCAADGHYCPEDTSACVEVGSCGTDTTGKWETVTGGTTKIRSAHWNAIRDVINESESTCICETEHCEFCSDCGYVYSVCRCQKGCYCDNSKYSTGCTDTASGSDCGSINSGGTHPFKTYPSPTPHDDYVPWAMSASVPGSNWSAYWSCKCSPFSWSSKTLKKDISSVEDALDKVNKLSGVSFKWISSGEENGGFIAEEVEEILPDAVGVVGGIKGIKPMVIMAYMVEAIKDLTDKIEELKK